MNDLISRAEAIKTVKFYESFCDPYPRVIESLEKLPSAEPEIIRCKDCKHKHLENMTWTCPFGLSGGEDFFCGYGEGGNK